MTSTKTLALVAEVERLTKELAELRRIHDQTVADGVAGFKAMAIELAEAQQDAERMLWMENKLFDNRWNGVMGTGSARQWSITGSYRHTVANMVGNTFRAAIDAAMRRTDAGAKTG